MANQSLKKTKNTVYPAFTLTLIPIVALIGLFFGLGVYHLIAQTADSESAGPSRTNLASKIPAFRDAYAQDYEAFSPRLHTTQDAAARSSRWMTSAQTELSPAMRSAAQAYEIKFPDASASIEKLKRYIAALRDKNVSLAKELSTINVMLSSKASEIDYLKKTNSRLAAEIAAVHREYQGKIESLQAGLLKERQAAQTVTTQVEQKTHLLSEKMRMLQNLIVSREEEIKRLRAENNDLGIKFNRLFDNHITLKEDFDSDVVRLSDELGRKQLEVTNLNVMKEVKLSLENQIKELTGKVADLNSVRVELEHQLRGSRKEQIEMKNQLQLARGELAFQQKLNHELKQEIVGLRQDAEKKAVELDSVQAPYKDLQQEIGKLRVIKEEYEKRIAVLNDRIAGFNMGEDQTQQKILQLTALLTRHELEKEFQLQEQAEKVLFMEDKVKRAEGENQELLRLIDQKNQKIENFKVTQVDTLKEQISLLHSDIRDYKKRQAQLQKELTRARSLSTYLHRRMKKMHMELQMRRAKMKEAGF